MMQLSRWFPVHTMVSLLVIFLFLLQDLQSLKKIQSAFKKDQESLSQRQEMLKKEQDDLRQAQAASQVNHHRLKQGLEHFKKIQEGNASGLRRQHGKILQIDMALEKLVENFSSSEHQILTQINRIRPVSSKNGQETLPILCCPYRF